MKVKLLTYSVVALMTFGFIRGVLSLGTDYYDFFNQNDTEPTQAVAKREVVNVPLVMSETPTVERLLELTNAERAKIGVKPLILDERLNTSAQKKVAELSAEGWDETPHVNDAGVKTTDYAHDSMPICNIASENLLYGFTDVKEGFGWWMNSTQGHREAILDSKYDYVGFAVNERYIAQHFCDID